MAYGTSEFAAAGLKPFETATGTNANATSVTVNVNNTGQRGVVLVDGEMQPNSYGLSNNVVIRLKSSTGTIRNMATHVWQNGSGNMGYNGNNYSLTKLCNSAINANPNGAFFQIWLKFGTNNSAPYEDVMWHARTAGYNGELSNFSSWRGMGRLVVAGDVSQMQFQWGTSQSTNIHTYRIRCYSFFG